MRIDLNKVLAYSHDCMQSRAKMRAIVKDMYPNFGRDMNVLLDVFESGVPNEIRNKKHITRGQYDRYIAYIIEEYGLQEKYAIEGLDEWIRVCGVTISDEFESQSIPYTKQDSKNGGSTNVDNSTKKRNRIKHDSSIENNVSLPVAPLTPTSDSDFAVQQVGQGVQITKYLGFEAKRIVIPGTINGKPVMGIGRDCFRKCRGIEEVIISENIEQICELAFAECDSLKKIVLPESLMTILNGAFQKTALTDIYIPDKVMHIGSAAFDGCKMLASVDLPARIHKIGASAFGGTGIEEINLPNSLSRIENRLFDNSKLNRMELPDKLVTIGAGAFRFTKITSFHAPRTLKKIEADAFSFCSDLNDVELNEGLEEIEKSAFEHCGFSTVTIPKTVRKIGENAFQPGMIYRCYAGSWFIGYAREKGFTVVDATK